MKESFFRFSPVTALVLLALHGCGGHEHRSSTSSETTSLTFSNETQYNGASGDLVGAPVVGVDDTTLYLRVTDGDRYVSAIVPRASIYEGSVISPGSNGGSFVYHETDSASVYREWGATAGSITVASIQNGFAKVTVDGLVFEPSTGSGNAASGTFQVDGKIVRIPLGTQFMALRR